MIQNIKKDAEVYAFERESLILRDLLATDRTFLANERTFLAYVRTALSIIAAGAGFIKLFEILIIQYIGYFLLPLGFIIGIIGVVRFIKVNRELKKIKNNANYHIE
ncbi:DUF202 domain-containing protein [Vallitalea okinawensis]|uniref:DUF202 domain-containing protein n=1 Tax=Vallitalea okinawensis TaxID=2078660 RepID=UPI000CFAF963|nr:DUF202 domain-containing protein [Vallitalea okinawensis]